MSLVGEFRAFIARGNVVDLAVGVVIGAAFGRIVSALVDGVVMPLLAMATGGVRVDQWKWVLAPAVVDAAGKTTSPEVAVLYGNVLKAGIDFLIVALVIFLVLRAYNRMRRPAEAAPAAPPEDVVLLREIRDLLKAAPSP